MKTIDKNLFPHHPPLKPRPDPCASFCNLTWNFFRGCPPLCVSLCPALCQPFPDFLHSPEPPSPPSIHTTATDHHQHHDYLSPVFIAMIVLLASAFAIVVSYLIYFTLFSSLRQQPQRSSRVPEEIGQSSDMLNFHPVWYIATVGLQRSTVESIGVCEYKKGDGLVQGTACVVCLAEFQDGDALRLLPKCCHAFHVPCIDTWFASHTTCPVCRTPVLQGNTIDLQPPRVEARLVEIVDDLSPSGEVRGAIAGEAEGGGEGEAWRPMRRRAASMDSLGVEVGEKMNTCASGSNALGERSLSCTGKLLSSSRHGLR